jgi:hypothetical protein
MRRKSSNEIHIFIGPTLFQFEDRVNDIENLIWHPPVKRNDINKLTFKKQPSTIVIADGLFHNCLSVGHREIREAIKKGWNIWGVSSIGAIRASEMYLLGMKGYGHVFENYMRNEYFRDDEVTVLHSISKPYTSISEPLIHIRLFLTQLEDDHLISSSERKSILKILSSNWYGDRTLYHLRELLVNISSCKNEAIINSYFFDFNRFRVKSIDFINFINNKIWLT